ncbi:MAG TPA: SRPBCC family protein [Stellaceae bacterium]|nr:SRPBCC family protein [Stellaceae bacterium]
MTERSTHHATFAIDRRYDAPPARVFRAWADPQAKASWFRGPPDKCTELRREFDFRVGGREHLSGRWDSGKTSQFDATYLDVIPDHRIIYSYDMHMNGAHISVSLATVEFKPDGKGTRLLFTEQAVMLDDFRDPGARGREEGTRGLLDRLGEVLKG